MLKAVIFDMDGVIIDSEPLHAEASLLTLKEFGVAAPEDYFAQFAGSTVSRAYETMKNDFDLPVGLEELLERDRIHLKRVYEERGMHPVPGVISLIERLYKDGVRLAIASSSSMKRIEEVTKAFHISKFFDRFISGHNLERPKPAPDIFLHALKELGVNTKETIVMEDSQNGCLAAKAAGLACVGYINPHSGAQDLSAASVLLTSMEAADFRFLDDCLLRANGLPVTIASTKRLLIRELTVEDIKELYAIYQNKEVIQYIDDMEDYLNLEIEKHKAYIKNVYSFYGYGLWGVFSKTTKKLIGRCGIENQMIDGKQEIELSYLLDKQHWGCGYALECCESILKYAREELSIPRVVAVIDKFNIRSIHVAENLGMAPEKEIFIRNRNCRLYAIDLEQKYLDARDKVQEQFKASPDTSVYGKRFKHE